jgi:hypothetical protein
VSSSDHVVDPSVTPTAHSALRTASIHIECLTADIGEPQRPRTCAFAAQRFGKAFGLRSDRVGGLNHCLDRAAQGQDLAVVVLMGFLDLLLQIVERGPDRGDGESITAINADLEAAHLLDAGWDEGPGSAAEARPTPSSG